MTNTTPKPIRYRTAKVSIGAAAGAAVLLGAVYLGTSAPAVASVATTVTTLSTSPSAPAVSVQRTRSDDGSSRASSDDGGYAATSNAAPAPLQQQSAPAPAPQPRVSRGS